MAHWRDIVYCCLPHSAELTGPSQVKCYPLAAARDAWQVWKLIPVEAEDAAAPPQPWPELFDLGPLPQHDLVQPPAPVQRMGLERDEFGTVVTEVTIVTTHKRYRVEDA